MATGLLLAASYPVLDLNTGQNGIGSLPESNVKTAYEALYEDFYVGELTPVRIVIGGDGNNPAVIESTENLMADLAADPRYGQPAIEINDQNLLAMITAPMQAAANSDEAVSVLVDATIVRSILVPSLMKLIGKYNWFLPSLLSWLPNVAIEGRRPEVASERPGHGLAPAPAGDD